jgi:hypothetical protein
MKLSKETTRPMVQVTADARVNRPGNSPRFQPEGLLVGEEVGMDSLGQRGADRVSRRSALKRLGAGAALAWTSPIMMSVRTPAFAQASGPGICSCAPYDCHNPPPCPISSCSFDHCVQKVNGECACGFDPIWSRQFPLCETDADCNAEGEEGWMCITVDPTCGAAGNVGCAPPCECC